MRTRRGILLIVIVAAIGVSAILSAVYLSNPGNGQGLPPGCTKPSNGFLVIASIKGYNDSIGHGAPQVSWPVIKVQKGSTVTITVCNTDTQAHGFQIQHYYDRNIESIAPGQVIHVTFVAEESGSFDIYCSVFCTIHLFMQNGQLVVN